MMWEEFSSQRNWEFPKNAPNDNNYRYFNNNRQYIKENYTNTQHSLENKPSVVHQVNPRPSNEIDSSKHYYLKNTYKEESKIQTSAAHHPSSYFVSKSVPSAPCSNLYVDPPFFTVDKFVNEANKQNNNNEHYFDKQGEYPRPSNGFKCKPTKKQDNILINNKDLVKVKLVGKNNIPLIHVESSTKPIDKYNHMPIMRRVCENDLISFENAKYNPHVDCTCNSRFKKDFPQNSKHNYLSIHHQCSCRGVVKLENQQLYRIGDNSHEVSQHSYELNDLHNMEYQGSPLHNSVKTCPIPVQNTTRESVKPNYRELINNAHAWRSLTSEDDLNMEIIKRTLNYNPIPKGFQNNFPSRNNPQFQTMRCTTKQKPFAESQELKGFEETQPKTLLQHRGNEKNEATLKINTTAPLDLSLKTIKTKAYSSEKQKHFNQFKFENGYPPKQNFEPNFYEEPNANPIKHISSVNPNTLQTDQSTVCHCNTSVEIHMPRFFTKCCNLSGNISHNEKKVVSLRNELTIEASEPEIRGNVIYSVQNCIYPQIMPTFFTNKNEDAGIEVEVTLKRSIPLLNADNNENLNKKVVDHRLEHSSLNECCANLQTNSLTKTMQIDTKPYNDTVPSCEIQKIDIDSIKKTENLVKIEQIKPEPNLPQANHDVSSIIAARIRTKAERKGFIFQDPNTSSNQVLNSEQSIKSEEETKFEESNEIDINMWLNDCNKFVDQLIKTCVEKDVAHTTSTKVHNISDSQNTVTVIKANPSPAKLSPKHKREFEEDLTSTKPDPIPLKKLRKSSSCLEFSLNIDDTNTAATNKTDKIDIDIDSHNINMSKIIPTDLDSSTTSSGLGENETTSKECVGNNQSDRLNKLKSGATEKETRKDEQNLETNAAKTIDLTKVTVVRLKRENYSTKTYNHNQLQKKTKLNFRNSEKSSSSSSNTNKVTSPKNPQNENNSDTTLELHRGRQKNFTDKFNSIKTRLRPKMAQSKTESKDKNKRKGFKNNKNVVKRCFQKTNESSNSDPEKLYLEVYRFKRALKIPPNLITIKNTCTQNMSTSLPDLDFDQEQSKHNKEKTIHSVDSKRENTSSIPRSIIDVLHSRVLKSKTQTNFVQKLLKKGNQYQNKSSNVQQRNATKSDFDAIDVKHKNTTSNLHESRNVFDTQVIPSRTRMEYKVQLSKEIIREIFGDSERPASAPPEMSVLEIQTDCKLSENLEFCSENKQVSKDKEKEKEEKPQNQETNVSVADDSSSNFKCISKVNEQNQDKHTSSSTISKMLDKSKRKKNRRMYRRRFSSGFDYLRKRKRNTKPTLYKYSNLKPNVENYEYTTKESVQITKNESDVSKEIQKWVLNKGVGQSALHKAARLGYTDVIVYCLEKMGLHPDQKDNAGYTPLHEACVNGSFDIVKILMQYGANHSEGALSGIRPIHEASENGHIEILRMLLSFGADPLIETYAGQTPLMLASDSEMDDFISMHLVDVQARETNRRTWKFPGPWNLFDELHNGCDAFNDISSLNFLYHMDKNLVKKNCLSEDVYSLQSKRKNLATIDEVGEIKNSQNSYQKNDVREFEIFIDTANADGELFEFEESAAPLPPLYLLKDEGMDKWVLLNDLCNLLKVKSKDTLLHKIFPSYQIAAVSRAYLRELKMCEFLERATCLQLLCAGEKINICHSKVVLIKYNENVRSLLGVKTIMMKL